MASEYENKFLSPIENDTEEFLKFAVSKLQWGDLSDEVILDIGCASGRSCKTIFNLYPTIRKVIGIDCVSNKIHQAQMENINDQIEYHVANIENRFSLFKWEGEINKIFSVFCFNWVWDIQTALQNVHHLLQPGGTAALLLTIDSPFHNCLKKLVESSKWKEYFQDLSKFFPDARENKMDFPQYRQVLKDIGFEIIFCEKDKRFFEYSSKEVFNENCVEKFPLLSKVPKQMKEEFKSDFFSLFEELNGKSSDGAPRIIYYTISLLLKKKPSLDKKR